MLNRIFGYFGSDIAVDLGTVNTLVGVVGRGLVRDEPSVVAVEKASGRILSGGCAVGHLAKQLLGRTSDSICVKKPLDRGVVTDFELCEAMLRYFLRKAQDPGWRAGPRLLIAVPGLLLSLVVVIRDLLHLLETKKADRSWKVTLQQASKDAWLAEALPFFAYVCGMIGLTLLIGQKIAMPLFIGVYLVRWGNYRKRIAVTYALGAWAILVFFYDQVMSLLFHPSYLALWLQPFLPSGVPDWLFL